MDSSSNNNLHEILREWVAKHESNGIKQHSDEWQKARVCTIGGSSLATIQGINPFSNIEKMIKERLGLIKFRTDIRPQWGNLFEDVIKRVVEYDHSCVILGEDLYIPGEAGISYSPDGLAVVKLPLEIYSSHEVPEETIVLMEFKCPYSRIPNGKIPQYYIPQVKMGLEVLNLPTVGLFVEGVFRRCSWGQLGFNPSCDQLLVETSMGNPLAIGIIGFYFNPTTNMTYGQTIKYERMLSTYIADYDETGNKSNDYANNDLGAASSDLFTLLIDCVDEGILSAYYGDIMYANNTDDVSNFVSNELDNYYKFCAGIGCGIINMGVLPWKLFKLDYNYVKKEIGYLEPWMPKINEVLELLKECSDPDNETKKFNILESFYEKRRKETEADKKNNKKH